MSINLILVILAALLSGALVAVGAFFLGRRLRDENPEARYQGQLEAILNNSEEYDDEFAEEEGGLPKKSLLKKWNSMWGLYLSEISGQYSKDDPKAGNTMIVVWLALTALSGFFLKSAIAAPIISSIILLVIFIVLKNKADRRDDVIRNQLGGFLFALKANIGANETPERSFMKVVDTMPSPLYDELLHAKNQIIANVGFSEAMSVLREETTSQDLRFLCSCMIQAAPTGVSLENQIDTIIESVEKSKRISEEISQQTKVPNMTIYASGIIVPAGFIGIYILDEGARDYWFVDPMSWAWIAASAVIAFIGIYRARKEVAKVREL